MTWIAKFFGTCAACGEKIAPGMDADWIGDPDASDRAVVHAECFTARALDELLDIRIIKPARPICPNCFMEIAISGSCGC